MCSIPLSESLEYYLQSRVPYLTNLSVLAVERMEGGWEGDIFAFDLGFLDKGAELTRSMILKLYQEPGLELLGKKHVREFDALRQLNYEGYPAPEVYLMECDGAHLGKPFVIMERITGVRLDRFIAKGSLVERDMQYGEMCKLFVRLHSLNWRDFAACDITEAGAIERELLLFEQIGVVAGACYAEPALAWLRNRASSLSDGKLALAHWDFHAGNLLRDPQGNMFVVDWCGANVTDYRFDLAWSTLFLGNFAPKFVELYAELAGRPVEHFDFFLAFAYFRRVISMVISLQHGPELLGMRAEAAEQMHHQQNRLRAVYEQWVSVSGVRLSYIETTLCSRLPLWT